MPKKKSQVFSDFEREAMQNRAKELVAEARAGKNRAQGERDVQAAIAKMVEPDKAIAKKIHVLVAKHAPSLMTKTWYGMPAYAKGGKVVCFFQSASKFKSRYSTLGFQDAAKLDDGPMWPVVFALKKLGAAEETKIVALLKKATR